MRPRKRPLGLGSVWLGAVVEPDAIRETLGLAEDLWPIVLLPIGYPGEQPAKPARRRARELIHEV